MLFFRYKDACPSTKNGGKEVGCELWGKEKALELAVHTIGNPKSVTDKTAVRLHPHVCG
jgi:hypothetical protein